MNWAHYVATQPDARSRIAALARVPAKRREVVRRWCNMLGQITDQAALDRALARIAEMKADDRIRRREAIRMRRST